MLFVAWVSYSSFYVFAVNFVPVIKLLCRNIRFYFQYIGYAKSSSYRVFLSVLLNCINSFTSTDYTSHI